MQNPRKVVNVQAFTTVDLHAC